MIVQSDCWRQKVKVLHLFGVWCDRKSPSGDCGSVTLTVFTFFDIRKICPYFKLGKQNSIGYVQVCYCKYCNTEGQHLLLKDGIEEITCVYRHLIIWKIPISAGEVGWEVGWRWLVSGCLLQDKIFHFFPADQSLPLLPNCRLLHTSLDVWEGLWGRDRKVNAFHW